MELAKLPRKISCVSIAQRFCNLPHGLGRFHQQDSRLGHAPLNDPAFYRAPRVLLHQAGEVSRRVARLLGHIAKVDGPPVVDFNEAKDGG